MQITVHRGAGKVEFGFFSDEHLARRIIPHGADPATIATVEVRQYTARDCGPIGEYTTVTGETWWVTHPGGYRHSGRLS